VRLHDCQTAPSPRRVRIFLAEKGIVLPMVQVDLRHGEQLTPAFRALNPWCTVPVLELDDGTVISEAIAICHYLETIHPEPALMGHTPAEKAEILMWEHRCEIDGFLAAQEAFRNSAPGLQGRAVTGAETVSKSRLWPSAASHGSRASSSTSSGAWPSAPMSVASRTASPTSPPWSPSTSPAG